MSIDDVAQFYDTIATDEDLRNKIIDANKKFSGSYLSELELERLMAEEFLPLLKEEGFYFSIDELVDYQNQRMMSDNNLENVSGGIGVTSSQAIRNLFHTIFYT